MERAEHRPPADLADRGRCPAAACAPGVAAAIRFAAPSWAEADRELAGALWKGGPPELRGLLLEPLLERGVLEPAELRRLATYGDAAEAAAAADLLPWFPEGHRTANQDAQVVRELAAALEDPEVGLGRRRSAALELVGRSARRGGIVYPARGTAAQQQAAAARLREAHGI